MVGVTVLVGKEWLFVATQGRGEWSLSKRIRSSRLATAAAVVAIGAIAFVPLASDDVDSATAEVQAASDGTPESGIDGIVSANPVTGDLTASGERLPPGRVLDPDNPHAGHNHGLSGPTIEPGLVANDAEVVIAGGYVGGEFTLDTPPEVTAPVGSIVFINIVSDVTEEVYLPGFEVFAPVAPRLPAIILFTADVAGTYDVSLLGSGEPIVELTIA